jgi:hypothetical protein
MSRGGGWIRKLDERDEVLGRYRRELGAQVMHLLRNVKIVIE